MTPYWPMPIGANPATGLSVWDHAAGVSLSRVATKTWTSIGTTTMNKPSCPHCGAEFSKLKDGKIPTHDFPPPCRAVCRGSGRQPRRKDAPLWKDDPKQEALDARSQMRLELLIYGFAAAKELAAMSGESSGTMECPLCTQQLKFSTAKSNGHFAARCQTPNCINMMEWP